ncbi:MAG: chromosome segregation protein ScpA [Firmicutes bacterium]|nr:chromosome segregation protein ScpA [Bacillota bacterium]
MVYEVQLESFQGPLELLYQLVKKNRIEISNISLASITEQYLDYLNKLQEFNLDYASEFMLIATELIAIKARTILPQDDEIDEEDEGNKLVRRLKEYHLFKKISLVLRDFEEKSCKMFSRPINEESFISADIRLDLDLELSQLITAYYKAINSISNKEEEEEGQRGVKSHLPDFKFEEIKIEDKTREIVKRLLETEAGLSFKDLINNRKNRIEIVVTFLSILELARQSKIRVKQDRVFSNINLSRVLAKY